MARRRFLGTTTLKTKLLVGFLLSLVPMLAITCLSYRIARTNTIQNSERLIETVNRHGAQAIRSFVELQEETFLDWT